MKNPQHPAQVVQPDPTGARARPRTTRTQDENLQDMEEMFELITRPSRSTSSTAHRTIEYTPCQRKEDKGISTYAALRLDLGTEERRREFETLVDRINRKREREWELINKEEKENEDEYS